MTPLREIRLYGHLGRTFGRVHHLAVASPAEAIRALIANHAGFDAAIAQYRPGWHMRVGADELESTDRLHDPVGSAEVIRIIPAVAGAKSGWATALIGVALIAAAVMSGGTSLGATTLWGSTTVASLAGSIGVSLALAGAAQLLAPKPPHQPGSDARDDQRQSYVFSGPVNTSQQGVGVPIIYGEMIVGSVVVSTGISVRELA